MLQASGRLTASKATMLAPTQPIGLCTAAVAILLSASSSNARSPVSLPRSLLAAGTPDCGSAYQPCCAWGESCSDAALSCIAREGGATCEPCGTPFSQPCPQTPYCSATELIPTTRVSASLSCT